MLHFIDWSNPLLALERWLSMLRYGRGVRFVVSSSGEVRAALRTLRRYGVRTYAYSFVPSDTRARAFRVRAEQAQWAEYLLLRAGVGVLERPNHPANARVRAGAMPQEWRVPARSVGFSGAVLAAFERLARK